VIAQPRDARRSDPRQSRLADAIVHTRGDVDDHTLDAARAADVTNAEISETGGTLAITANPGGRQAAGSEYRIRHRRTTRAGDSVLRIRFVLDRTGLRMTGVAQFRGDVELGGSDAGFTIYVARAGLPLVVAHRAHRVRG
jgi:hypothetical protein